MQRIKCGCEFNCQTLVSLCAAHAKYFVDKARAGETPPPRETPAHKKPLRNALLAAGMSELVKKLRPDRPERFQAHADLLVNLVHAIVEKTD